MRCRSVPNEPPHRGMCEGHAGTISKYILEAAVAREIAHVLSEPSMVKLLWEALDEAFTADSKPEPQVDPKAMRARITKLTA